jgi:hypothetical protein
MPLTRDLKGGGVVYTAVHAVVGSTVVFRPVPSRRKGGPALRRRSGGGGQRSANRPARPATALLITSEKNTYR